MTTEELIAARRAEPWREALRKSKKNKERTDIPRVEMNELDAEYRSHTRLEEVNLGLTKEQAMQEAQRCLDCPNPTCMQGCPVSINIPTFVKNIERGEFLEAARVLKETSALPAVCGRVCPQEKQCESKCIHLKMGKPAVAIGYLERFAADYERESGNISIPEVAEKNGIKIAVVGSGPAGLSFAGDMAKRGYDVTVFEALHEIGGVLKYGIPKFRLLFALKLASLMDGVGRCVPVTDNEPALVIKILPAARKARVPVNGVKGRRGVGIDGVRVLSEFTRQIHLDQCRRRLVVLRKFDVLKPDALRFEPLARTRVLGRFSRAVGSFKYNKFSHAF